MPTNGLKRSLLSSKARIQAPWIKVTIGSYTFGVYTRDSRSIKNKVLVQYPEYVRSLNIEKINGQVNKYTLTIEYPVRVGDDCNFFEKVFSSVSNTREIIFSYGDAMTSSFYYKTERAVITDIGTQFDLNSSKLIYTVNAVSGASLSTTGSRTFMSTRDKPSRIIKNLFKTDVSLQNTFTGMKATELEQFIEGDDQIVDIEARTNISVLEYINYLASCMIPIGDTSELTTGVYIMSLFDESSYEDTFKNIDYKGPYFTVKKASHLADRSDAYEIDVGYNTRNLVKRFNIEKNENYAIYFDYQNKINSQSYVTRIDENGQLERVHINNTMSKNSTYSTKANDKTWWTKVTQYPINANITVQGLLIPATLMTYVRLNVIFPGGSKHIASGLYLVTRQQDSISESGYTTQLSLTKIAGDNSAN